MLIYYNYYTGVGLYINGNNATNAIQYTKIIKQQKMSFNHVNSLPRI